MVSTSTIDTVPAAPIASSNGDTLAALLAQMNITGQQASDNALVSAVSAISKVSKTSAPLTPAPTPDLASVEPTDKLTTSPTVSSVTALPVSVLDPLPVMTIAGAAVLSTGAAIPSPAASVITQIVNVTYNVPAADATGPFYWVTRGRCIGIFSTWQQTSSHVIGVSRASFSKVHSVAEGIQLMEEAITCGETEVLP
ncbi:uncharacterized protein HD556DRAFT_1449635 [Suillus plorans]|uniref:Ribonuclease H1 N-terminal domain-containing protein n=1 Tax=Suillus plorans TaxID=116603 RepID=A0A9P7DBV6_9AGAM|nr:uncharacterized protein HD556DRAFT_1449635 [Suillus plorans]KAG1786546.1 hypothetical protein HD556DRAFT_1449635 [Suillus plorans]